MTNIDYVPYIFKNNKVGVFCDKNRSGKIVLEDIFKILYPTNWEKEFNNKSKSFDSEVSVETVFHNGIEFRTVDETDIRVVYSYCDDAPDEDLYKEFIQWLEEKLCYFLEIEKPKLGSIIPMLSVWDKEIENLMSVLPSDKINEELTIKEWLKEKYSIEIPWLCEITSKQIDNEFASTYRSTTGNLITKRNKKNYFTRLDFVRITPKTDKLLGEDFSWLKKSLQESKGNNGKYYSYISEFYPQVRKLLDKQENIDEIINKIWNKAPNTSEFSMLEFIIQLIDRGEI
jgi:hypothetical protein